MEVINQTLYQGFSRYLLSDGVNNLEVELSDEEIVLSVGEEVVVDE